MSKNLKKMISYYKPYLGVFWADMFFATVSAAVALVIPLVIRYACGDFCTFSEAVIFLL